MKWRVAYVSRTSTATTSYKTVDAETAEEAARIVGQRPNVVAIKWVNPQ